MDTDKKTGVKRGKSNSGVAKSDLIYKQKGQSFD